MEAHVGRLTLGLFYLLLRMKSFAQSMRSRIVPTSAERRQRLPTSVRLPRTRGEIAARNAL